MYLEDLENYITHEHVCLLELLTRSKYIYDNKQRFKKYCKCRKKLDQNELVNKNALIGEQQCDTCPYFIGVDIFKDKIGLFGIDEMQSAYQNELDKLEVNKMPPENVTLDDFTVYIKVLKQNHNVIFIKEDKQKWQEENHK